MTREVKGPLPSVVCDGCGLRRYCASNRVKPRGWAMVLQKESAPAKHYCERCKQQKSPRGPRLKTACDLGRPDVGAKP